MFNQLVISNQFVEQLPADPETTNRRRQVHGAAYSLVSPTPCAQPQLLLLNQPLAQQLGFTTEDLAHPDLAGIFTGSKLLSPMKPYAMCYGGHQFGQWAGQLGDGRAINLCELGSATGAITIQLKGAGLTPYSRTADGLAVLRSSVREYLCSEAMFYLGIPTTRALSLSLTGEQVIRDVMYDGNPAPEPGAVVVRTSPSFLRFGNFQLASQREDYSLLRQLADHAICQQFSHLIPENGKIGVGTYLAWFGEIAQRTCQLAIHWSRVGFVHGVLNTDNTSIIGETIDYGPYGWIDDFDLDWTPNTTDAGYGRYRFGQQGKILQWNLVQLANALYPLIQDAKPLQAIVNQYAEDYQNAWGNMMASKLGLASFNGAEDLSLFVELEQLLSATPTDMTLFYRQLAEFAIDTDVSISLQLEGFAHCYYQQPAQANEFYQQRTQWFARYQQRLMAQTIADAERKVQMNKVNPWFILRNYLAQLAIDDAEQGDYDKLNELAKVLTDPYQVQEKFKHLAEKRPDWAVNKVGCSMLSCSS